EGHGLGVHHRRQARVFHHLGIDAVALPARLVDYPGEHHGLVRLELDGLRERSELARLHVVSDAFNVIKSAEFLPDLSGLARHAAVGVEVFLRNRDNESIDIVGHTSAPWGVGVEGSGSRKVSGLIKVPVKLRSGCRGLADRRTACVWEIGAICVGWAKRSMPTTRTWDEAAWLAWAASCPPCGGCTGLDPSRNAAMRPAFILPFGLLPHAASALS